MENENEDKNLKTELLKTTDGYREGAIAGAIVGIVIAAYMKKKIMIGALLGMIGGGYIGYSFRSNPEEISKFKKQ